MKLRNDVVQALRKVANGTVKSVHDLSVNVKWELWENGLVKDNNTITNLGKFIVKESIKKEKDNVH